MGSSKSKDDLADGLRALELLARLAPIDLAGYAKAGHLSTRAASSLVETFESSGFTMRLPSSDLHVLTSIATELVFAHNFVGTLVVRALPSIGALGRGLGVPVTLSIRRGAGSLRVLASENLSALPVGQTVPLLGSTIGEVFSAFNGDRLFGPRDRLLEQGYGLGKDRHGGVIAIPLLVQRRPVAVLAAHWPPQRVIDPVAHFLPVLSRAALNLLPQAGPHSSIRSADLTLPSVSVH